MYMYIPCCQCASVPAARPAWRSLAQPWACFNCSLTFRLSPEGRGSVRVSELRALQEQHFMQMSGMDKCGTGHISTSTSLACDPHESVPRTVEAGARWSCWSC